MQNSVKKMLRQMFRDKKRQKRIVAVICALSVLVATGVFNELMQPVITMTPDPVCGVAEHAHTSECYQNQLVCGIEESEEHAHGDGCFESVLACGKSEHEHGDSCYPEEIKDQPVVTAEPEVTAEPTEVPAVPATVSEEAPEVTAEPESTKAPEVTAEPEITAEPEVTAEPETTEVPEVTAEPETTDVPEVTAEPETTEVPEVTAEPETTAEPDPTAEPAAPAITGATASAETAFVGQTVTWTFAAEGASELTYSIDDSEGNSVASGALDAGATCVSWLADRAGAFTLTVTAVNEFGSASITGAVTVEAAAELTAAVRGDSASAFAGESATFHFAVSGGVEPTAVSITVEQDGETLAALDAMTDSVTVESRHMGDKVTTLTATITAADSLGTTVSDSVQIPVAVRIHETESDWIKATETELTDDWRENLIAVAKTQLGYEESRLDFVIDEEGNAQGYTRYGQWWGASHDEWCAMFASFCLNYAEIPDNDFPREANCEKWIDALNSRGLYAAADEVQPEAGDLIFFDWENDGKCDHVGIVTDADTETIATIEGNSAASVRTREYEADDECIIGFGLLTKAFEHHLADELDLDLETGVGAQALVLEDAILRAEPASDSMELAALTAETLVTVTAAEQNLDKVWYEITTGDLTGYLPAATLALNYVAEEDLVEVEPEVETPSVEITSARETNAEGVELVTFTAALNGISEADYIWQWQSAETAEGPWTDIEGATGLTYTAELTDAVLASYYRIHGAYIALPEEESALMTLSMDEVSETEPADSQITAAEPADNDVYSDAYAVEVPTVEELPEEVVVEIISAYVPLSEKVAALVKPELPTADSDEAVLAAYVEELNAYTAARDALAAEIALAYANGELTDEEHAELSAVLGVEASVVESKPVVDDYASLWAEVSALTAPAEDADEAAVAEYEAARTALIERTEIAWFAGNLTEEELRSICVMLCVDMESLMVRTMIFEGEDYTVTVSYGADAKLPENVELRVSEIQSDDEDYAEYANQAAEMLLPDMGNPVAKSVDYKVSSVRLFDITLWSDDIEIEPSAGVNVTIVLGEDEEDEGELEVVHFHDNGEVEKMEVHAHDDKRGVSFGTDGFSVYALTSVTAEKVSSLTVEDYHIFYVKDGDKYYALGVSGSSVTRIDITDYVDANGNILSTIPEDTLKSIEWTYTGGKLVSAGYTSGSTTTYYQLSSNLTLSAISSSSSNKGGSTQFWEITEDGYLMLTSGGGGKDSSASTYYLNYSNSAFSMSSSTGTAITVANAGTDTAADSKSGNENVAAKHVDLEVEGGSFTVTRVINGVATEVEALDVIVLNASTTTVYEDTAYETTVSNVTDATLTDPVFNSASVTNGTMSSQTNSTGGIEWRYPAGKMAQSSTTIVSEGEEFSVVCWIAYRVPATFNEDGSVATYEVVIQKITYIHTVDKSLNICPDASNGGGYDFVINMTDFMYDTSSSELTIEKLWSDDNYANRPSTITATVLRKAEGATTAETYMTLVLASTADDGSYTPTLLDTGITAENMTSDSDYEDLSVTISAWKAKLVGLKAGYYDSNKQFVRYSYTVDEQVTVTYPDNFDEETLEFELVYGSDVSYDDSGIATSYSYTLINSLKYPRFAVQKIWADGESNHTNDSVTVKLWATYSGGTVPDAYLKTITGHDVEQTLNASNNWTFEWGQLPIYYTVYASDGTSTSYPITGFYVSEISMVVDGTTYDSTNADEWKYVPLEQDVGSTQIDGVYYAYVTNVTGRNLVIEKTDASGNALTGATFQLYKLASDGATWVGYPSADACTYTVDSKGQISLATIETGSYKLVETVAPAGYYKLTGEILFEVSKTGITITSTPTLSNGTKVATAAASVTDGTQTLTITVKNQTGTELPSTGGPGKYIYTICGLFFMAASLLCGIGQRRKRERGEEI